MSNVQAKPTWIDIGDVHIKRRNFFGWKREEPGKIQLYLTFKHYGLHSEWVKGTEEEMDEMEEELWNLRNDNML